MAKILSGNINLTKIDKTKIATRNAKGETFKNDGKFLNIQIFLRDEPDQFGNNASIAINQTKEEREANEPKIYLGNAKIVWEGDNTPISEREPLQEDGDTDGLPF